LITAEGLIAGVETALRANSAVLGVFLSGSYGRGTNDGYSDVDITVVVTDMALDGFTEELERVVRQFGPLVYCCSVERLGVVNAITPEWLRFGLLASSMSSIRTKSRSILRPVFDPSGIYGTLPERRPGVQTDPARMASRVREFLRVFGLLPVAIGRGELIVAVTGGVLLRAMLIDLYLDRTAGQDNGGVLHANQLLSSTDRLALEGLPPLEARRDSVVEFHLACVRQFLPVAREMCHELELRWPSELEQAAFGHVARALSVTV
jgi:hypothetical protein